MSNVAELIGVSQDFVTSLSPNTSLRKWLKDALADDDLALFFMYSEPPSETECKYGVQLIDPASLPIAPNAYSERKNTGTWSRYYYGTEFMGFTDAATLLSAEWLEDFEKISQLNGVSSGHDGSSTLCLVPASDVKMHKTSIRYDSPFTCCGTDDANAWVVAPYKWAVLARKSAFNPRLRSWFGDGEVTGLYSASYPADYLLFDFRGGIPLTVGTYGSEADIWLGEQWVILDPYRGKTFMYPSSVEIGRINIPKLGS
tara:strand:+ start:205496 stop:206266 length:771 start_codon:yes stop_codon:yes gene_type:complete